MTSPAMPSAPRHLVGVWNPSYEADAMDAHVSLLLRHAREHRAGAREESEVYVWWGKLRSPNRQAPLPHLHEILALDEAIADETRDLELHLYLTDYRSLYVAHLGGVTEEDMRLVDVEEAHVPDYYREGNLPADCWFQLWDIRRLVLDDTPAVIDELKKLRNTRYHDQRVSLYGGMVDLPLIVTRPDGGRWFDDRTRDQLTDGRHWVEFDAERSGAGAMQRDLRENRFGARLWSALDPGARAFVATAEQTYRAHRNDAAFDMSAVLVDFARAAEVQVNHLLRAALTGAGSSPDLRHENVDGKSVDLAVDGPWSLGALERAIAADEARNTFLKRRLFHGEWFTAQLPPILGELREARNKAAHGAMLDHDTVGRLREQLIGVGCPGWLLELAKVRVV